MHGYEFTNISMEYRSLLQPSCISVLQPKIRVLDYPAPRPYTGAPGWRAADTSKSQLPLSISHRPIKHTLNPLRQLNRLLRLTLSPRIVFFCFISRILVCCACSCRFGSWPHLTCRVRLVFGLLLFYHSVRPPLFSRDVDCLRWVLVTYLFAKVFLRTLFNLIWLVCPVAAVIQHTWIHTPHRLGLAAGRNI